MATKSRRIELRSEPEQVELIARAAALEDVSMSAFVIGAAASAADRVLARRDTTAMAEEQFDRLMDALDDADPAPRLHAAADGNRRYTSG